MTYQVLARKWRPRNFQALVGQTHVLQALTNALDQQRVHHAYLFTGTRGVGKTTIARILAKCLNCEQGVSATPCGVCSACREIDEGRFVDLIEVDAASRTKVEDTRELLDNVPYAPTRGRYKVYLIDEVHMLSTHSFNALLKTLEEPPEHIKFLLATTDPQKLPVTILSRCLQFALKNMAPESVMRHLTEVLTAEQIVYEEEALWLLARAADGSMRDALSLTDQAIAFGNGQVLSAEVRLMLGSLDHGQVLDLLVALSEAQATVVLEHVARWAEQGVDWSGLLAELLNMLHRVAIAQVLPQQADVALGNFERIQALAARIAPEDVQFYYQMGLIGRRDLPLAPDPRYGFEMILLRMLAFHPESSEHFPERLLKTSGIRPATTDSSSVQPVAQPTIPVVPSSAQDLQPEAQALPLSSVQSSTELVAQWQEVYEAMQLSGLLGNIAANCSLAAQEGDLWTVHLDPQQSALFNPTQQQRLNEALNQQLCRTIKLQVIVCTPVQATPAQISAAQCLARQQAAEAMIHNDPLVQRILEQFNASIKSDSIQPIHC